jgi:hypothetical protein
MGALASRLPERPITDIGALQRLDGKRPCFISNSFINREAAAGETPALPVPPLLRLKANQVAALGVFGYANSIEFLNGLVRSIQD